MKTYTFLLLPEYTNEANVLQTRPLYMVVWFNDNSNQILSTWSFNPQQARLELICQPV